MALRVGSLWVLFLSAIILSFQNCGPQPKSYEADPLVYKVGETELVVDESVKGALRAKICSANEYICEHRLHAAQASGASASEKCVDVSVYGRPESVCAQVFHLAQDATNSMVNCVDCGEYFCHHAHMRQASQIAVVGEGSSSLDEALMSAVKICEEKLDL